jgi:hypothetical protein
LFEHDPFGKPVSTFPDHALGSRIAENEAVQSQAVFRDHKQACGFEHERNRACRRRTGQSEVRSNIKEALTFGWKKLTIVVRF